MKKHAFLTMIPALVLGGCASRSPEDTQTADTRAGNSSYSHFDDRREELARDYLTTGEARTLEDAQTMASEELGREWAERQESAAEEARQADIQESLRDAAH